MWILNYINKIPVDVRDNKADREIEEILDQYTLKKRLRPQIVEKIKTKVCDLGYHDCDVLNGTQCIMGSLGKSLIQ